MSLVTACMEGWVDSVVYSPTVTHPGSNRARCRATLLIKMNTLTTVPGCYREICVEWFY